MLEPKTHLNNSKTSIDPLPVVIRFGRSRIPTLFRSPSKLSLPHQTTTFIVIDRLTRILISTCPPLRKSGYPLDYHIQPAASSSSASSRFGYLVNNPKAGILFFWQPPALHCSPPQSCKAPLVWISHTLHIAKQVELSIWLRPLTQVTLTDSQLQ